MKTFLKTGVYVCVCVCVFVCACIIEDSMFNVKVIGDERKAVIGKQEESYVVRNSKVELQLIVRRTLMILISIIFFLLGLFV